MKKEIKFAIIGGIVVLIVITFVNLPLWEECGMCHGFGSIHEKECTFGKNLSNHLKIINNTKYE